MSHKAECVCIAEAASQTNRKGQATLGTMRAQYLAPLSMNPILRHVHFGFFNGRCCHDCWEIETNRKYPILEISAVMRRIASVR